MSHGLLGTAVVCWLRGPSVAVRLIRRELRAVLREETLHPGGAGPSLEGLAVNERMTCVLSGQAVVHVHLLLLLELRVLKVLEGREGLEVLLVLLLVVGALRLGPVAVMAGVMHAPEVRLVYRHRRSGLRPGLHRGGRRDGSGPFGHGFHHGLTAGPGVVLL